MGWLHDLSTWVAGVAIVALFVGTALSGLALTRGWSRRRGLHALVDNGVIGWIFSAVVGIYAIAIGLIAVASWSNTTRASSIASEEAAQIAALYRDVQGYPQPLRSKLEQVLIRHTENVIEKDWPAQRGGIVPHEGRRILDEIEGDLYHFEPSTAGQEAIHAEALHAFNRLIELRRERLEAVEYSVPGRLWGVVLIGAVLSILASYVFSMETLWVHATMTGLLAAMISLLVFFIAVTDLPFRGASGLRPEAYELVLSDLKRTRFESAPGSER